MTTPEAIYRAALEHISDGSDAVCTECGWMGDIDVSHRVGEVPSFLCPQCRAIAIEYGERKIAAYALAKGGEDHDEIKMAGIYAMEDAVCQHLESLGLNKKHKVASKDDALAQGERGEG